MTETEIKELQEANQFMINERHYFLIPLIATLLEEKEIEISFKDLQELGDKVQVEVEGVDEDKAIIRKLERNKQDEKFN